MEPGCTAEEKAILSREKTTTSNYSIMLIIFLLSSPLVTRTCRPSIKVAAAKQLHFIGKPYFFVLVGYQLVPI